jgi:hypothetical protein
MSFTNDQDYTRDLIKKIICKIKEVQEIHDFVASTWGEPLTIFIAANEQFKPPREDCPYLAFYSIDQRETGVEFDKSTIPLAVQFCTENSDDEEIEIIVSPPMLIKEHVGFSDVEHLSQLVSKAILDMKGIGAIISTVGKTGYKNEYPFWISESQFNFKFHQSLMGDVF